MSSYSLDEDEAVILQATDVYNASGGTVDLVLTNKNLIQINKGIFGGEKDAVKYPLSDLKILNGKANVLIEKGRNGVKQLEVYFSNCEKFFRFNGVLVENKWANAITKAHKERLAELQRMNKTPSSIDSVLNSITGSLVAAKDKIIVKKEPVKKSNKCPKCGAELIGYKDDEVKCAYCDAIVVIK